MKSRNRRKMDQRAWLWRAQDGRCYWCKQPTKPGPHDPGDVAPDAATLDHLHSRLNAERGRHAGKLTHVMACRACNERRGWEECAALPIEEQRRRAGRYPAMSEAAE